MLRARIFSCELINSACEKKTFRININMSRNFLELNCQHLSTFCVSVWFYGVRIGCVVTIHSHIFHSKNTRNLLELNCQHLSTLKCWQKKFLKVCRKKMRKNIVTEDELFFWWLRAFSSGMPKKNIFFKTFLDFPKLDIFKMSKNRFPFYFSEKSCYGKSSLENVWKNVTVNGKEPKIVIVTVNYRPIGSQVFLRKDTYSASMGRQKRITYFT